MAGQIRRQVCAHRDRPDTGATAAVRDAERLVQVQVADVAAELARPGQSDQRVEVRAVDVHLAADVVHGRADVGDVVLVHAVGGRIGDHQGGQPIRVFGDLGAQVVEVDVAVGPARHHHDPHARQRRRRRVGAVRAGRDQTHVAVGLTALGVVGLDRQQAGVLALRAGVGLQRHRVVPGHLGQPGLEVGDQLAQTRRVGVRRERMLTGELGPGDRLHLGGRVEFHRARAERNHAAVQRDVLVGQRPQVAHHLGLGAVARERRMGQERRTCGWRCRACREAHRRTPPCGSERRQHRVDVLGGGRLVTRHRHVVVVDQPDVDAARLGLVADLRGAARAPGPARCRRTRRAPRRRPPPTARPPRRGRGRAPGARSRPARRRRGSSRTSRPCTASSTWAVQMLLVALSRRMCCSRVCSDSR